MFLKLKSHRRNAETLSNGCESAWRADNFSSVDSSHSTSLNCRRNAEEMDIASVESACATVDGLEHSARLMRGYGRVNGIL